ncbi:MAG TPA: hypothetical protein VLV87_09010 [Gammaproteobacteria bacterium]|nr:hypothetical protein [Gammaproteobacteria bacterium]
MDVDSRSRSAIQHLKAPCGLAALALLAGCATAPEATDSLQPGAHLAVLQLATSVSDAQLRRVLHSDRKDVASGTLESDRTTLEQSMDMALQQAFSQSADPILVSARFVPPGPVAWPMTIGEPLDAATLARLQAAHPADAYLRLRVTDYGQTPGKWKSAYISFEVATTLAIGGLLYVHKATRPLAGIYLLQEGIEEYSEGYAGWWLFNRLSRPVRIEADLIDGKSGAVLWSGSDTGMAAWTWHHLWHVDDVTRHELLKVSTAKAAKDLVVDLGGPDRRVSSTRPDASCK